MRVTNYPKTNNRIGRPVRYEMLSLDLHSAHRNPAGGFSEFVYPGLHEGTERKKEDLHEHCVQITVVLLQKKHLCILVDEYTISYYK